MLHLLKLYPIQLLLGLISVAGLVATVRVRRRIAFVKARIGYPPGQPSRHRAWYEHDPSPAPSIEPTPSPASQPREGGSQENESAFTGAGGRFQEPLPSATKTTDEFSAIKKSYDSYVELLLIFPEVVDRPARTIVVGRLPRDVKLKLLDRSKGGAAVVAEVVIGELFDGPRPKIEVVGSLVGVRS